jgi:hypothetical protein
MSSKPTTPQAAWQAPAAAVPAGLPPSAGPPPGLCWLYRRGEWLHAADPLASLRDAAGDEADDDEADDDLHVLMSRAGFTHMCDHGEESSAVWLAHYVARDGVERHIIMAYFCDRAARVLVEDAPSLLQLLASLLPVVEAVARLEEARWREGERRRARKRGPVVYNPRRKCMEFARAAR